MKPVLLITLIMFLIFGVAGVVLYITIKKVDPKNKDSSEDPSITQAQAFLPFEDIRNNMIILPNHCYRAILSCSSTNYQLRTAAEREQIEMSFQRFLNTVTFPITFFLQTQIIDNSTRMAQLAQSADLAERAFPQISTYAQQYQKDMAGLSVTIGVTTQKKRYIIVSYDDAGSLGTLSEEEKVTYAEKELQHRCNSIMANLQAVGVRASLLKTNELIELIYSSYSRDDYSYAEAIAKKEPFSLFVSGDKDRFESLPKTRLLDLILGEAISQISLSNIDADYGGRKVLETLQALRQDFSEGGRQ